MRQLTQQEHVLTSLNALLGYLYSLSYLLFPSFSLFAARWIIQYAWLALQKEVVRHQLRWSFVPLTLFIGALWVHSSGNASQPIILDFISDVGGLPRQRSVVILLDLAIVFLELLVTAILYQQVMSFADALGRKRSQVDGKKSARKRARSHSRIGRTNNIVFDMPLERLFRLCFFPKFLYNTRLAPSARAGGDSTDEAPTGTTSGLPLPFNLNSTQPNRTAPGAGVVVPGALAGDW